MEQKLEQERNGISPAVYVPWKSFLSAIESLQEALPPSIDRSVFRTFSGGLVGQVLSGFRFLNLIDENGLVQPDLMLLVDTRDDERKAVLKDILTKSYPRLIELGAVNATFQKLNDTMRDDYGVKGGTLEKANRFFLDAATYAGLQLSPHWTAGRRGLGASKTKKKKVTPKDQGGGSGDNQSPGKKRKPTAGTYKSIELLSGGSVSLNVDTDWLSLSQDDRDWLFELVDKLNAYEDDQDEQAE